MAEAVGACALVVVAYLASRPRRAVPLWSVKPVLYTATPAATLDIDPVRDRIRRRGDRLPIRRHDGSDSVYEEDADAFVAPLPPLPTEPEPEPEPDTSTGDAVALALDAIQARLHVALDAQYVAFCAALQVPVAVPSTANRKARKGKKKENPDGRAQEARRLPERDSRARARGRRRVRGGVRVA